MKIETLEDLEDALSKDLAWRKKELFSLKILIDKEIGLQNTLVRVTLSLLCAHFEGFIKRASNIYLDFVAHQKLPHKDLQEIFSVMTLHKLIIECAKSSKHSVQSKIIKRYNEILLQPFRTNDKQIDTQSNPSSTVLKEILFTLGISSNIFDLKSIYIDRNLLSNRHKIVHGEYYVLEYDDFLETLNTVLKLLDDYKELIIDAASQKAYKRGNNETIL